MFSASLISAIFHLVRPLPAVDDRVRFQSAANLANVLRNASSYYYRAHVPLVASSKEVSRLMTDLGDYLAKSDASIPEEGRAVLWGRVPIDALVAYYLEFSEIPPEDEYIDLGTRFVPSAQASRSAIHECEQLLATSPLGASPSVVVAFVDEGSSAPGATPEDFGGRLIHVNRNNLALSRHAANVLYVLLERLKLRGILEETLLYCALVDEPARGVGPSCFTHANSPNILSALEQLSQQARQFSVPVLINLSMGTHVGPHNGESPLENYVKNIPVPNERRYLFVSAGNDGLSGVSGSKKLRAHTPDFLRARVERSTTQELLIEFWWKQADGGNISIDVEASDDARGSLFLTGTLRIDSTTSAGAQLTHRGVYGDYAFSSLFCSSATDGMSCIAFAMSSTSGDLSATDIIFTLTSEMDVTVNAWIVVGKQGKAYFVNGGEQGTLRVPSTVDGVVCVAGVEADGTPWARSSRGPATSYTFQVKGHWPSMAHLAEFRGDEKGTSFASPRACADAAAALMSPKHRHCQDANSLVRRVLKRSRTRWDPRVGYGKIIS
jgi:hypothetical protein